MATASPRRRWNHGGVDRGLADRDLDALHRRGAAQVLVGGDDVRRHARLLQPGGEVGVLETAGPRPDRIIERVLIGLRRGRRLFDVETAALSDA